MRRFVFLLSLLCCCASISQVRANACDTVKAKFDELRKGRLDAPRKALLLRIKTFLEMNFDSGDDYSYLAALLVQFQGDLVENCEEFLKVNGLASPIRKPDSKLATRDVIGYDSSLTSIAVGDFNGDGRPDGIYAAGFTYYLQLGRADGTIGTTLADRLTKTFPSGALISDLEAIDINNDRRDDLIAIDTGGANVTRRAVSMISTGDGNFQTPTAITPANCSFWVGDWNADGRLDVVTCPTTTQAAVFLGQANGTFLAATPADLPAIDPQLGGPLKILATDLNGDAQLDVAVLYPNRVAVLIGRRDGTLAAPTLTPLPFAFIGAGQMLSGDVTGDRRNDLVVSGLFPGLFTTLVGDGTGRLTAGPPIQINGNIGGFISLQADSGAALLVPDRPGSRSRIVPITATGSLGGNPLLMPSNAIAGFYLGDLVVGDFLGNGRSQVILLSAGGQTPDTRIQVFSSSTGIYNLTELRSTPLLVGGRPADVVGAVAGQFDSDRQLDIAAIVRTEFNTNTTRSLVILRNAGGGAFTSGPAVSLPAPFGQTNATNSIVTADFNGDGISDVAVSGHSAQSSTDGQVLVYFGAASGTLSAPTTLKFGDRQKGLGAADFNGDGRVDLAVASETGATGTAVVYLSQANNSFAPPVSTPLPEGRVAGLLAGAITGQNRPDLVIGGSYVGLGSYLVLKSKGDGTFTPILTNLSGRNPDAAMSLADFNSDGKLDLFGLLDGGLAYYLGRGDGTFGVDNPINAGDSPAAVFLGDLAGTNAPELVVRTGAGATIVPFSTQGVATTVSAASNAPIPLAPASIASVYGTNLATGTAGATSLNQTNLLGTRVLLHQYTNWFECPLFFVSPGQVNFLLPLQNTEGSLLRIGPASVQVTSADGATSIGDIEISSISPGLFVANTAGLLAGNATRVRGNQQTPINIVTVTGGQVVAVPIDLGPEGDRVVLTMFATGVRGRTSLANVRATIGGAAAIVSFAGPQGSFAGLDQINVEIPRSLAGRGDVAVALTVDGVSANVGRISIQ